MNLPNKPRSIRALALACVAVTGLIVVLVVWISAQETNPANTAQRFSPRELDRLRDDAREFDAMPASVRAQIMDLHQKLAVDPQREQLTETMVRYARWLDTLTPSQRKRIDAAESTDDRIRTVSELIREQRVQLAADLKQVRDYNLATPEFGRRMPSNMAPNLRWGEMEKQIRQNGGVLTPIEAKLVRTMKDWPPGDRAAFTMLLGMKYNIIPELNAANMLHFLLPESLLETEMYRRSFAGVPMRELPTVERERLVKLLLLCFALPEVSERSFFDAYGQQERSSVTRRVYSEMHRELSARPFAALYYFDFKDRVPTDLRSEFDLLLTPVNPPIRPIAKPPVDAGPMPNLRDRIKDKSMKEKGNRFLKKAKDEKS